MSKEEQIKILMDGREFLEYLSIEIKDQLEGKLQEYIRSKNVDFIDDETAIGIVVIALNKKYPNDQDFGISVRNLVNSFKIKLK